MKKGMGFVGDRFAGKPGRHIVILDTQDIDKLQNLKDRGLCIKRFEENIETKSAQLYRYPVGTMVKIGESLVRISQIGKRCFPECPLNKDNTKCPLANRVVFAEVMVGGKVCTQDLIEIIQ